MTNNNKKLQNNEDAKIKMSSVWGKDINPDEEKIENSPLIQMAIIHRRFLVLFLGNYPKNVWQIDKIEQLKFVYKQLTTLFDIFTHTDRVDRDAKLSKCQELRVEYLSIPYEQLKTEFLECLNGKTRYSTAILDHYNSFYDFFEDYGQYKLKPLYRNEIKIISELMNKTIKICEELLK